MASALDLRTLTLERFRENLTTFELLPSRKVLADHIDMVVAKLAGMDVTDLEGLRRLLADKNRYPELANQLGVDESYLLILNREVNAYRTKPTALGSLDVFSDNELSALAGAGIKSTKHLYDRCVARDARMTLAADLGVEPGRLQVAPELPSPLRVDLTGGVDDDVVAVARRGKVPVDSARGEEPVGDDSVEQGAGVVEQFARSGADVRLVEDGRVGSFELPGVE